MITCRQCITWDAKATFKDDEAALKHAFSVHRAAANVTEASKLFDAIYGETAGLGLYLH